MTINALQQRSAAYEAYVARGRARFAAWLPSENFDASTWTTTTLARTAAAKTQPPHFTKHGSLTELLPPSFTEPVKAWMVLAGGTASRLSQRSFAARWLWKGIEQRLGEDAMTVFTWEDLRHADLQAAEQLMLDAQLSRRTVYGTANAWVSLVRDLALNGVAPTITFTPMTARHVEKTPLLANDPEGRGQQVLSPAALAALADIFHQAVTLADRFYSAQMALLVATGLRWNESVTLPVDPLVEQDVEVRDATGALSRVLVTYIRRHKAKSRRMGGGGRPNTELQPLTDEQATLARLAINRLRELCEPARRVAVRLEHTAPQWRWPGRSRPRYLRTTDLSTVLDFSAYTAATVLREIGEPDLARHSGGGFPSRRVPLQVFEQYMTDRQMWSALTVLQPGSGYPGQRASESLICLRVNELRQEKLTLPLIAPPSHAGLVRWLHSDPTRRWRSVFERAERDLGIKCREPDGALVKVDSHMCRRLFVTTGLTAGATIVDMARWQGREQIRDLANYDQRSMAERVSMVKEAIMTGRLRGQVAQAYVALADEVRDAWLDGQVQAMHVTPLGLCVHDYSTTPCQRALNCLNECPDYLYDPSNSTQVQALVQLRRRTHEALTHMQPDIARGRVASAWVDMHQRTLRNVERVLVMVAPGEGELTRPFADGVSRFQPLAEEA